MLFQIVMVLEEERKVLVKNSKCQLIFKRKAKFTMNMTQAIIRLTRIKEIMGITNTKWPNSILIERAHLKAQRRNIKMEMINIIKMIIVKIAMFIPL